MTRVFNGSEDVFSNCAVYMCHQQAIELRWHLIRDIRWVSEWCDLWEIELNASKTRTMIVTRSRAVQPQSPPLTIDGDVLKESNELDILGVTFDSKMTFDHHRSVFRAASHRLCILRKSW